MLIYRFKDKILGFKKNFTLVKQIILQTVTLQKFKIGMFFLQNKQTSLKLWQSYRLQFT